VKLKAVSTVPPDHHSHVQLLAASLAVCPACSPNAESVARAAPQPPEFPPGKAPKEYLAGEMEKTANPCNFNLFVIFFQESRCGVKSLLESSRGDCPHFLQRTPGAIRHSGPPLPAIGFNFFLFFPSAGPEIRGTFWKFEGGFGGPE
jgi:hypothetical protein